MRRALAFSFLFYFAFISLMRPHMKGQVEKIIIKICTHFWFFSSSCHAYIRICIDTCILAIIINITHNIFSFPCSWSDLDLFQYLIFIFYLFLVCFLVHDDNDTTSCDTHAHETIQKDGEIREYGHLTLSTILNYNNIKCKNLFRE